MAAAEVNRTSTPSPYLILDGSLGHLKKQIGNMARLPPVFIIIGNSPLPPFHSTSQNCHQLSTSIPPPC
jgi:hypothetical protein